MSELKQTIRFCTSSDGTRIAYATMGGGPPLVWGPHFLTHLEFDLRSPVWRPWLVELTRSHTLVRYDGRGCGLSDRDATDFTFESSIADLAAVVDAARLIASFGPIDVTDLAPQIQCPTLILHVRNDARVPFEEGRIVAGLIPGARFVPIEGQWGFRPEVFTTTYASATNEVYLIDEARLYEQYGRTLDDALSHELVHYIQAKYLGDRFTTDWSETEAVAIQSWFRREFMAPRLAAARPPRVTSPR